MTSHGSLWARHCQFDHWQECPIVRITAHRVWIAAGGGKEQAFDRDKLAEARSQRAPHGEQRGGWSYYDGEGKARWERDRAIGQQGLAEALAPRGR